MKGEERQRLARATPVSAERGSVRARIVGAHVPVGCAFVGLDGRVLWADEPFCSLVGRGASELSKIAMSTLLHPDDRALDSEVAATLWRGGEVRQGALVRCVHPDGTLNHVALHRSLTRDLQGEPVHFVVVLQDATDRVRRRQDDLLAMLGELAVGVVVFELGGALHANARAEELFGGALDRERIRSMLVDTSGRPIAPERLPWVRVLAGERLLGQPYAVERADGRRVAVLCSAAAPFADVAVCTFEDVSAFDARERKTADWLAMISHDLVQPMSAIRLYARRLRDQPEHERIVVAIRRLEQMIASLRDASGLDVGRLSVCPEQVDLVALVESCAARWNDDGAQPVRVVNPGSVPAAFADPMRTEQVLENLVGNARKYGASGSEIVVTVEARAHAIEISVCNVGLGIDESELAHVFDRYHRSPRSRASGAPGLGLGLYIARGLVEAQGGRIRVESTLGQQTTFRFELPLASDD